MIKITITRYLNNKTNLHIIGHADYAEAGSDIVCAAVSALVINAINSIETMTEVGISGQVSDSDEGLIDFSFDDGDHDADVLFRSLEMGLSMIEEEYSDYISIIRKEVTSC